MWARARAMQSVSSVTAVVAVSVMMAAAVAQAWELPSSFDSRTRGDGSVITDAKGMTLYTFDRDEGVPGRSACEDACANTWPAVTASAAEQAPPGWSKVIRRDGSLQWAYAGKPLYRYVLDDAPGATFGDGVGTVWRVALKQISVPPDVTIRSTTLGRVLADAKGLTLYTHLKEIDRAADRCVDASCAERWQPLSAPWSAASVRGDWSVVVRPDGGRQWAYKNQPLYRYSFADVAPGEIFGHGISDWRAVVLEPAPPLPPWATIQPSDAGELIANEQGLTVYSFGANARGQRVFRGPGVICPDGTCVDPQWKPFKAQPSDQPIGSWGIVRLEDGSLQWTYKGMKLYTNELDTEPGHFRGIRFGGDRSWSAIMRSGEPMQGVTVGG
jgi:predicted lipoprotein with Yx(FWY)xxD motif